MMLALYFALLGLFLMAVALILLFYYRNHAQISRLLIGSIFTLFIICSVEGYRYSNHLYDIRQWYTYGKRQYEFLTEYEKLGGINGMIKRIHRKLEDDPTNFQAWVMLGKLHLAKLEYREASEAFNQALLLHPNDHEIKDYYELAKRS